MGCTCICHAVIYGFSVGVFYTVLNGALQAAISYDRISKVLHLEYSYVLMCAGDVGIVLDINGFTKGTFTEVKQFLREKRPDLKIPE